MSSDLSSKLSKLQELRKRKKESEKQNREELFKEHKRQAIGETKLRAMALKQEKAVEELEKLEASERGEDWDRKKAWDYTIQEYEDWDKKQEQKSKNIKNGGFTNYSQLAEQSYKKEVGELKINKEEYLKARETSGREKGKQSEGNEEVLDYSNKPAKEAVDRLVGILKESDSRKMKRRKDYDTTHSYSKYNAKLN